MLTRAQAQALVGQRICVTAPAAHEGEPQSPLHGEVVTVHGFSPTQPEVWQTSGGPLQWSRAALQVEVVPP